MATIETTRTDDYTAALIDNPSSFADLDLATAYELTREQRDRIALAGLRRRFAEQSGAIDVLRNMAEDQGIVAIARVEDGAYLLFPHTAYKSYPLSILEKGQFDRLTRWLQGLTCIDLSKVDVTGIRLVDDWIEALEKQAGLQIVHTSGTTGKLSFLPRAADDGLPRLRMNALNLRDWEGPNSGPDIIAEPTAVIYPSYGGGSTAPLRSLATMKEHVARTPDNVLTLYPDTFSADVASLGGRLRAAEERGQAGQVTIPPELLAKRDEFIARDRERAGRMEAFFAEAETRFAGRDIMVSGVLPILYDWAEAGLARGTRGLFGPNSMIQTGGGSKGRQLPDNAMDVIAEFLGTGNFIDAYGMSEMSSFCPKCEHGNYHIPPYIVPYVLDGETGALLPREGRQTGRFGFVDLFPADHWGGFLTGDKVTIGGWDEPCACGRTGPHVEQPIQRFSELNGGDDKITCAGAPAAQDKAIEFLAHAAG